MSLSREKGKVTPVFLHVSVLHTLHIAPNCYFVFTDLFFTLLLVVNGATPKEQQRRGSVSVGQRRSGLFSHKFNNVDINRVLCEYRMYLCMKLVVYLCRNLIMLRL